MPRSLTSRKQKPLTEFKFVSAWLVWEYDWEYGPDDSERYFYPSVCKVFLNQNDAEMYAKEHGNMDVDEVSLQSIL